MNVAEPEKSVGYLGGGNTVLDLRGHRLRSANLTPDDETGIGRWSEHDFVAAVRGGFRPDRTLIRYPMAPMPDLSEDEAGAIYAYLRTVPAIRNYVPRDLPAPPGTTTADGKQLYERYGCVSCHGDDGVGIADLRAGRRALPDPGDPQGVDPGCAQHQARDPDAGVARRDPRGALRAADRARPAAREDAELTGRRPSAEPSATPCPGTGLFRQRGWRNLSGRSPAGGGGRTRVFSSGTVPPARPAKPLRRG